MSDISSLPGPSRRTVENFMHRSEFWSRVPGNERLRFWEWDDPDRPYFYTASQVVQFTKANCLAAVAANNSAVEEFRRELQIGWETNRTSPLGVVALTQLMGQYLVLIDRIFFFGLITHPTRRQGKLVANQPIIKLLVQNGLTDPAGNELNGIFTYETGELWINALQSSGEIQFFEEMLATIVHELVHVYLHVLTRDNSAASYYRELSQDEGHGVQFHELLQFILAHLFNWMPTILYLGALAKETGKDLQTALAKPSVFESVARSLIYAEASNALI
ncbi:hypothetical protein E0Z10_g7849 [Xylaria hypoxylon]|uniref:SprT-like domain-containing protein n=1 Tax=Xylaria hypoxylon TaxID=37992 RepID=A0A4Z0YP21_9PEZI|nr:hypothetical protein E0Z10_g7849 [Xylaria hypoxylon]